MASRELPWKESSFCGSIKSEDIPSLLHYHSHWLKLKIAIGILFYVLQWHVCSREPFGQF